MIRRRRSCNHGIEKKRGLLSEFASNINDGDSKRNWWFDWAGYELRYIALHDRHHQAQAEQGEEPVHHDLSVGTIPTNCRYISRLYLSIASGAPLDRGQVAARDGGMKEDEVDAAANGSLVSGF